MIVRRGERQLFPGAAAGHSDARPRLMHTPETSRAGSDEDAAESGSPSQMITIQPTNGGGAATLRPDRKAPLTRGAATAPAGSQSLPSRR